MKEISTIMIKSDYSGDRADAMTCPGHKAFRRAYLENMPWYSKLFKTDSYFNWIAERSACNSKSRWKSTRDGHTVNMMSDTKVGDKITFIKL